MCITENERQYLLNEMKDLLDEYGYDYLDGALNRIISTWAEEKETLIQAFKRHPNYIDGKFMIAFDCDYDREVSKDESFYFGSYICNVAREMVNTLPEDVMQQTQRDLCICLPNKLWNFFSDLNRYAERTLSEETANRINEALPVIRPRAGEKTSRCINRMCTYLGYNKHPEYNREFAKYADSLSPLTIKRHTILSINPLDYLTMSFGNSWSSCHTIDKNNKRNMPNSYGGMYSSGTMSYMLDESSMVFYIVDAAYDGNEYYTQPKINRQMFHWGAEKLVQGRLYPQANDGNGSVYTQYRNIVQGIMAQIFDFPNLWTVSKGYDNASAYIYSHGTHYRDYCNFDSCTLSRIKGVDNSYHMTVGHRPICICCGCEHDTEDNINCCGQSLRCADCGDEIDEDDVIWIDGAPYCHDCVNYCYYCDEYHRVGETYIRGVGYVCDACLNRYYVYCEDCETYHHRDDCTYVESVDRCVCDDCLREYYIQCDCCGDYFIEPIMSCKDGDRYLCEECLKKEEEEDEEDD